MATQLNLPASKPKTRLQRAGFWIAHSEHSKLVTLLALIGGLTAVVAATILNNHGILASILLAAGIFSLCYVRLSAKVKRSYSYYEYMQSDDVSKSGDHFDTDS